MVTNGRLMELLWLASLGEEGHRARALRRAARAAMHWPVEASSLLEDGRSLQELPSVGPWLSQMIEVWLEAAPPVPPAPQVRDGFLTMAQVVEVLRGAPEWASPISDLQVHTTYSDGGASILEMLQAARSLGRSRVGVTDHSKGLPIANGMDEDRLRQQWEEIEETNEALAAEGAGIRALRSIEMNLDPSGRGDMDPDVLGRLDLVLGAFHSSLRLTDDQTDRYLAAISNPHVHVLAHPQGRRFGVREGLRADWPRVFSAAQAAGVALEVDAHPDRQDLRIELLGIAVDHGVWISIGSDAHAPRELANLDFGLAAAALAGAPRDRVLNFMSDQRREEWVAVRGARVE